MECVYIYL